ncbi:MAG TPA: phage terminase large subunit [Bryocella sp.]|nr:phage terminase large subunit [Bryocella sp.]
MARFHAQLLQELKYDGFDRATGFKAEGDKQIRMFTVTSTIENGFVHVSEIAEWAESYLYELTLFPNGTFADQVDSTSQALGWYREHESKYRYGFSNTSSSWNAKQWDRNVRASHMFEMQQGDGAEDSGRSPPCTLRRMSVVGSEAQAVVSL